MLGRILLYQSAAIDHQVGAIDHARVFGSQEGHRGGDVFGLNQPPHGVHGFDGVQRPFLIAIFLDQPVLNELRPYIAGMHAVDADIHGNRPESFSFDQWAA